LEEGKKLLMR